MLIDWFTVGAQALNFVVLVWLMKHFLYRPVLDAIDVRERSVAARLAEADQKKAAAQGDRDDLRHRTDAFEQQRAGLLAKASADADAERRKLLDAARLAADALTAARQQAMVGDARNLSQALRRRTQAEVFAIARRTLADLATVGLEASVCDLFLVRLRALDGSARGDLAAALKASRDGALVRTAFELPEAERTKLRQAVDDLFAVEVDFRYVVAPDLVGGIELSADGQRFAWSIADYLASLERGVDDLLKPTAKPDEPPVPPAPEPAAEASTRPASGTP